MTSALQFDPESHAYSVDGRPVPSVTGILEDAGIIDYSAIPDGTRMMALERGRFVHSLCEFDDDGTLDPESIDPKLAGYLAAWRAFRILYGFIADQIEHRGYSERFGYAGTLDRRGCFHGGQVAVGDALVDIKTTQAPYWTAYQTAAYAAFFESPAKLRRMAVALHADGTFRVYEYRCADYAAHFNVFLAALAVFNAKRSK